MKLWMRLMNFMYFPKKLWLFWLSVFVYMYDHVCPCSTDCISEFKKAKAKWWVSVVKCTYQSTLVPSIQYDILLVSSALLMLHASLCCGSDCSVGEWLEPPAPPLTTALLQSAAEPLRLELLHDRGNCKIFYDKGMWQAWLDLDNADHLLKKKYSCRNRPTIYTVSAYTVYILYILYILYIYI